MPDAVDLQPTTFAELVAPAVTRTFVAGMRSGGAAGRELVTAYGGPDAIGYVIDLRNPLLAGRPISRVGLAAVYRYAAPETVDATVARSVEAGLLARAGDAITATDRGLELLTEVFALHGTALAERWGLAGDQTGPVPYPDRVHRLNELVSRVLAAAAETGGAAWAVQSPPYEPDGTPPGVLLLNRLSTLRYHRADAHAAAWQAAGLTAAEVAAMPWDSEWPPQRHAVEHDTNVRASAPYGVLAPAERLTLLADLASLV